MRKVVVYELLSLDGVAEEPLEFITDWDDVMRANLERVITTQDTVLLGRRTYDDWAAFWPGSDIEPFASFINGVQKFVASSTPLERPWSGSHVLDRGLAESVADLKRQDGGDIGVHGSISLTQSLLEGGLVDELRLVVAPVLQVHGRRLFDRASPKRLSLTRAVTSPTGCLLADFDLAD